MLKCVPFVSSFFINFIMKRSCILSKSFCILRSCAFWSYVMGDSYWFTCIEIKSTWSWWIYHLSIIWSFDIFLNLVWNCLLKIFVSMFVREIGQQCSFLLSFYLDFIITRFILPYYEIGSVCSFFYFMDYLGKYWCWSGRLLFFSL